MVVGDVNVYSLAKPNLVYNLGFALYTTIYYFINWSGVLTWDATPVPGVCNKVYFHHSNVFRGIITGPGHHNMVELWTATINSLFYFNLNG